MVCEGRRCCCTLRIHTAPHTRILHPTKGNLHELVADATKGCMFLDVLTPPYDWRYATHRLLLQRSHMPQPSSSLYILCRRTAARQSWRDGASESTGGDTARIWHGHICIPWASAGHARRRRKLRNMLMCICRCLYVVQKNKTTHGDRQVGSYTYFCAPSFLLSKPADSVGTAEYAPSVAD